MSVLFGVWQVDGDHDVAAVTKRLGVATSRFAPDAEEYLDIGSICFGQQLLETNKKSRQGFGPIQDAEKTVIAFNGRLDNDRELAALLGLKAGDISNSRIVLTGFRRSGIGFFSQLQGEWSVALWSETEQTLYLVKDHAGTRSLFYQSNPMNVVWSSYLETLLSFEPSRSLDHGYAASYLCGVSARNATPYRGIKEVPAGSIVRIRAGREEIINYWSPLVNERISYRTDGEYEQHFLHLFRNAVDRRMPPADPVIAELSGGMDSTSIVCISDRLRSEQFGADAPKVHTLSYLDDSEPNWNERPFIEAVELSRGQRGTHIASSYGDRDLSLPDPAFLVPGVDGSALAREQMIENSLRHKNHRIFVSGFGGDELLGGPSNPLPELADCLASGQWRQLRASLLPWCIEERSTVFELLLGASRFAYLRGKDRGKTLANKVPWLSREVVEGEAYIKSYSSNALPSASDAMLTWNGMLESLPDRIPNIVSRREYRYPILDRSLVEFLLRVPANQLRRPGQRRSLMRRALSSTLPVEVLKRTRKAYLQRGPVRLIYDRRDLILSLLKNSRVGSLDFVDVSRIRALIQRATFDELAGRRKHLMRFIHLEIWLRAREL